MQTKLDFYHLSTDLALNDYIFMKLEKVNRQHKNEDKKGKHK